MDQHDIRLTAARMRSVTLFLCGLSLSLLAGCAYSVRTPHPPVTVPQIVEMSKAGVPPGDIVQKMHAAGTDYRLEASQLAQLQEQGVPEVVLNYMQQTYLDSAREDQRREDLDYSAIDGGGYIAELWW